jgi:hypothetical protein
VFLAIVICTILQLYTIPAVARYSGTENKVLRLISAPGFPHHIKEDRCALEEKYIVYLIDNFTQTIRLVPELETTHGEMLYMMLISGRKNIDVKVLNTPLSDGLAHVLKDLINGKCVNAVVSSTPGSNYTYGQIESLLGRKSIISSKNILLYRSELKQLLSRIAFSGFPSLTWLKKIDANPVKLKNDARALAFIEALQRFKVPVYLPYGNADTEHNGQVRNINIFGISENAIVYSALDQFGNRVPGFPYSPLSTGDEPATFELRECIDPINPFRVMLDINEDGHYDYSYQITGDSINPGVQNQTLFELPLVSGIAVQLLKQKLNVNQSCQIAEELGPNKKQFWELSQTCLRSPGILHGKMYTWLNAGKHQEPFFFDAKCWSRGRISGTSFIPPNKVKEILP